MPAGAMAGGSTTASQGSTTTSSQITTTPPPRLTTTAATVTTSSGGATTGTGTLPNTGYDLLPETLIGFALVAVGIGLKLRRSGT